MVQPISPYTKTASTISDGDSRIRPGPQWRTRPRVERPRRRGGVATVVTVAEVVVTGTSVLCGARGGAGCDTRLRRCRRSCSLRGDYFFANCDAAVPSAFCSPDTSPSLENLPIAELTAPCQPCEQAEPCGQDGTAVPLFQSAMADCW